MATIPALFVVGGTIWLVRSLTTGHAALTRRELHMRRCIRAVENVLVNSINAGELTDGEMGRLLLLLRHLEEEAKNLSLADRQLMTQDLRMLRSCRLSTDKKLLVIQRMYRSYSFLRHAPD